MSPEVSHSLEFSYMEINKTALNKSRSCTSERREPGKSVGEKERQRVREKRREGELSMMMSQDPSGVLFGSQKKSENCKRLMLMSQTIVFEETPESADGVRMINTKTAITD